MDAKTKVRENMLRRIASRQGLRLQKSRQRDPMALDYGKYSLVNGRPGHIHVLVDRGISIKLRSGLRAGIGSIFGEDAEQHHYLSPVTRSIWSIAHVYMINLMNGITAVVA
jgi:hypothetical protein